MDAESIIKTKERHRGYDTLRCPYCDSDDAVKYGFQEDGVCRGLNDKEIPKLVWLPQQILNSMPPLFNTTESTMRYTHGKSRIISL